MGGKGRKKGQPFPTWQAKQPYEPYNRLSISMRKSPAYKALNKLQTDLLNWCMQWTYEAGAREKPNHIYYPRDKWSEDNRIRATDFFANIEKAKSDDCQLVTDNQRESFYNARKWLVRLGFLDCIIDGGETTSRIMSVYRMSNRWQSITDRDVKRLKQEERQERMTKKLERKLKS